MMLQCFVSPWLLFLRFIGVIFTYTLIRFVLNNVDNLIVINSLVLFYCLDYSWIRVKIFHSVLVWLADPQ